MVVFSRCEQQALAILGSGSTAEKQMPLTRKHIKVTGSHPFNMLIRTGGFYGSHSLQTRWFGLHEGPSHPNGLVAYVAMASASSDGRLYQRSRSTSGGAAACPMLTWGLWMVNKKNQCLLRLMLHPAVLQLFFHAPTYVIRNIHVFLQCHPSFHKF